MGQRSRKRRDPDAPRAARRPSAERDAEARAQLEPLGEGERPPWVTYAAIFAFALAAANVIAPLAGAEVVGSEGSAVQSTIVTTILLVLAAYGMFRAKYWAVLGFQAILLLQIMLLSLFLVAVTEWWQAPLVLLYLGVLALFFWKLVKAMARLQMPERRPS